MVGYKKESLQGGEGSSPFLETFGQATADLSGLSLILSHEAHSRSQH
jgi:hypothetical protein